MVNRHNTRTNKATGGAGSQSQGRGGADQKQEHVPPRQQHAPQKVMHDATVVCVTKIWAQISALGVMLANLGSMQMQCVLACQMILSSPFWTMEEMVCSLCALTVV